MHDNKRLGKKIVTFLWIIATIVPSLLALYFLIRMCLIGDVQGITNIEDIMSLRDNIFSYEGATLLNFIISLNNVIPSWLSEAFVSISDLVVNTQAVESEIDIIFKSVVLCQFAWAIYIQMFHILYDLFIVLFKLVHNFFSKAD